MEDLFPDILPKSLEEHEAEADPHPQYALLDGTKPFTGTIGGVDPVAQSDLATKGYIDGTLESTKKVYTANSQVFKGRVVAIRSDGEVEHADKDDPNHKCGLIIGLAGNNASAGNPVTVTTDGILSGVSLGSIAIGLFLGNNGLVVSTPPSSGILQRVGEQIGATEFNVKLQSQIIR